MSSADQLCPIKMSYVPDREAGMLEEQQTVIQSWTERYGHHARTE